MSYTQQEIDRLIQLKDEIEGRKEHAYAAPTYLDSPALAEMTAIVTGNLEENEDVLEDKITVLDYLTDCYDDMGRTGISVKLYRQLLEAYAQLAQKRELSEEEKENLKNTFYCALLARNRYVKDDCEDLVQFVSQLIGDEKVKHCKKAAEERIRVLPKLDPVELTDAYLAVIDEVERRVKAQCETEICHEYWMRKENILLEYGIEWRSPASLNPKIMFD